MAVGGDGLRDQVLHVLRAGDVPLNGDGLVAPVDDFPGRRLRGLAAHVHADDARAAAGQRAGDLSSDVRARARYDCYLSFQHVCLLEVTKKRLALPPMTAALCSALMSVRSNVSWIMLFAATTSTSCG